MRWNAISKRSARLRPVFRMKSGTSIRKIPWKTIVGLRNKVIHHYFAVDPDVIYRIATKNIPETKDRIAGILKEYSR